MAVDVQTGLNCISRYILLFAGVLVEMLEIEEPGLRVYNVCQVKFKDCQRAYFLPVHVETEPITPTKTGCVEILP